MQIDRWITNANTMDMVSIYWLLCVIVAYLIGSVNFAIILARSVRGEDIRTLGNRNPGTANVGRSLGAGWGALVLLLDISKSVLPILLARTLVFDPGDPLTSIVILTVGLAAVIGHCRPLYYGFRGGGGIATSIGVYVMLVPVEALVALFAAAGIVALAVRNVEHKFGPYTPVLFVTLMPALTTVTALWLDIPVFREIRIGAHRWYEVAGVLALSLSILALNPTFLHHRLGDLKSGRDPAHGEKKA